MTGHVRITDHGATGDGVTDDTAAIQACWDSAPPGAAIQYPLGVCQVTGLVHPPKPLNHVGVSVSGSIIRGSSPTATFQLSSVEAQPNRIAHLRLENTGGGIALLIESLRTTLQDVHAESLAAGGGTGIEIRHLVGVHWSGVTAYGTTYGLRIAPTGSQAVNLNVFTTLLTSGCTTGIGVCLEGYDHTMDNLFLGVDAEGGRVGFYVDGVNNTFEHPWAEANTGSGQDYGLSEAARSRSAWRQRHLAGIVTLSPLSTDVWIP